MVSCELYEDDLLTDEGDCKSTGVHERWFCLQLGNIERKGTEIIWLRLDKTGGSIGQTFVMSKNKIESGGSGCLYQDGLVIFF